MKRLSTEMKIRPIKGLSQEVSAYNKLPTPITKQTGRLTFAELEELNHRINNGVIEAVAQNTVFTPEIEREIVMEMVERMKTVPMDFGNFKMPPPRVTSVSYSPENGYIVHVDQNLPPIPSWVEIKASYNDAAFTPGVINQEGDVVTDVHGETFKCHSIHEAGESCECICTHPGGCANLVSIEGEFQGEPVYHEVAYQGHAIGTPAPFNFPADLPVDALMDYQVAGESKLKIKPSGEVIVAPGGPFYFSPMGSVVGDGQANLNRMAQKEAWEWNQKYYGTVGLCPVDGPRGPVGSPGAPGQPGIPEVYPTPIFLRSSSTKPLMYSVDVYKSLKESQYVAISSFPVVGINDGTKIKPYAVGATVQDALNKLAESIRGWTGRKELGIINEHMYINQWVCVHCHDVRGYPTKQELLDHIGLRHSGNIGLEKYTNPAVVNVWLRLP